MAGTPKEITADGQVLTGPGSIFTITLKGTGASTLILYDNTAASGTKLCDIASLANDTIHLVFPRGLKFSIGIYADIGGTGAISIITVG